MELLIFLALLAGLVLFVLFAKICFAILVWPFKFLFFLIGAFFTLLFLPFQLLGGLLLLLLILPLLGLGLAIALTIGIPVLLFFGGMLLLVALFVGGALLVGGLLFGH